MAGRHLESVLFYVAVAVVGLVVLHVPFASLPDFDVRSDGVGGSEVSDTQ